MKKCEKELMQVDLDFCEKSKTSLEDAWDFYMSEKVIMGTGKHEPYLEKKPQIIKLIEMTYKLEGIDFTWAPDHVFVSEDETLGVTTGKYTRKYIIEGRENIQVGKYCTTWQKEKGLWKIVLDIGN